MMVKLSIITLLIIGLIGCKEKKIVLQSEIDEDIITNYISENSLNSKSTESGLYYTVEEAGTGLQPNLASTVTVVYKGYLTDGYVFDKSDSVGLKIALSNVIDGWQQGIPLFKEGGSGTLLIPSILGYGAQGSGAIPKNAVIIFDIKLLKVE